MNYKLIIFDMDGTILDTLDDITNSVNQTFNHFNLNSVSKLAVRKALGNGARRLITDLLDNKDVDFEAILAFYLNHYTNNNNIYTKPYKGIIEVLNALKKDYKLAVVSNKSDHLVKALNKDLFDGLFDISIGEQKGLKVKPHSDMLDYVINYFNLKRLETLFIGDSEVDIQTANNTNVNVIAVTWGFRDLDELKSYNPNYIVDHPVDILSIIKKLD